jgi:glycosyltransferase involved in cell wall biosynthesis
MHVVRRVQPDVVVFCHWPSVQIPTKLDVPTVLDFHGPHLLEREMQGYSQRGANIKEKIAAVRKADFFTCAGERQRHYFLSWLLAAGIEVSSDVIASIPVSLSPELPDRQPHGSEPTFVYGGVFLPWQDPFNALDVTLDTLAARGRGTLRFFGGRHPAYADQIGNLERFDALEIRLRNHPRVRVEGMVQHAELIEAYRHADVALDVMGRNPEREMAFTTRTVEYLWCGLPVIYQDYAELSDYIREYDAGWLVNPDDAAGIRRVVEQVLDEPAEIVRRRQNAQQLVRERLTWNRTIEPLDAFCHSPWQREPLPPPLVAGQQVHDRTVRGTGAESDKAWRSLLHEAAYHYRHGGLRRLTYYALGFAQKRLNQTGDYWP